MGGPLEPTLSAHVAVAGLSKRYGAANVLDRVDFSVEMGALVGLQLPPIGDAVFVDDEIDRIRSIPRFEDKIFIQIFVPGGGVLFEEIRELIHEEKLLFEIETEAVSSR